MKTQSCILVSRTNLSILLVLILITSGQTMAKAGAVQHDRTIAGINGFLVASYLIFFTRGILWAMLLTKHSVSRVYPYLSISFPLILIVSLIFFDETLSIGKIVGAFLILSGTALMSPKKTEGDDS